MADAPVSGTLAVTIRDRVRAEILSGKRRPQTRIRLEDLRTEFDVSWSPLREAVSSLVAEGLIQPDEARGYRVAGVSRREMVDITRMRSTMESMALRLAIQNGDDHWEADVLSVYHRLSKLEGARERNEQIVEWERRHRAYHDTLASGCGSPILLEFCAQLQDRFSRYRKVFFASNPFDKQVPLEHRKLTKAALARDADKACGIIETHITRTGRNILACIKD